MPMSDKIYLIGQGVLHELGPVGYVLTEEEADAVCAERNTKVFLSGGDMDGDSYWCEGLKHLVPSSENVGRDTALLFKVRLYSAQNTKLLKNREPKCEWITAGCVFADVKPKIVLNQLLDKAAGLRCLEVIVPASTGEEAITKAKVIEKKLFKKDK